MEYKKCEDCVHFDKEPIYYPCSQCSHKSTEYFEEKEESEGFSCQQDLK